MSDLVTLSSAGHLAVDVERPAGVEELRLRVDELSGTLEVRDKEVECVCFHACKSLGYWRQGMRIKGGRSLVVDQKSEANG